VPSAATAPDGAGLVDANVFIRLLSGDDPLEAASCLALFKRVEQREVELFVVESVVAEVVYVLGSPTLYRQDRPAIAARLRPLLELRALRVDHKRTVIAAIDLFESSRLDFEDCLTVAHARRLGLPTIYSYDRHFDRIEGVIRREP
jgi:predicted nucleic acid-binding protein